MHNRWRDWLKQPSDDRLSNKQHFTSNLCRIDPTVNSLRLQQNSDTSMRAAHASVLHVRYQLSYESTRKSVGSLRLRN